MINYSITQLRAFGIILIIITAYIIYPLLITSSPTHLSWSISNHCCEILKYGLGGVTSTTVGPNSTISSVTDIFVAALVMNA